MNPDSGSISSLETHLGYWLRQVSNHVSQAFERKVEDQGVTVAEWVVLRVLFDEENVNPSQIARKMGMTRGAISKLVDRLVEKRLLKSRIDPGDRRFQSVTLTPAGRKLVPLLAQLADENDAEFFACLGDAERTALMAMLKKVVRQRGMTTVPTN